MAGRRALADEILERRTEALARHPAHLDEPGDSTQWPIALSRRLARAMLAQGDERRGHIVAVGALALGWLEAIDRDSGAVEEGPKPAP